MSGRPETSRGETSEIASRSEGAQYIPHVFDFVGIHRPANSRSSVPSVHLEPLAVDQSVVIGHGASFTAFQRSIPALPTGSQTAEMADWSLTVRNVSKAPEKVVYKVARVAFTATGVSTAATRPAMKAALMELYALMHEPLQRHPNIIKLLGLAWGANLFDPTHRLPVLVVEYAEHGSLAELQAQTKLSPAAKRGLALDIGRGLQMLHRCGIVHGDVKSENVLIFRHAEREYIAKMSDFGFSTVREAASEEVFMGGTRPWKAPETRNRVARERMAATDVYSYGLLLWRLAADGHSPFGFIDCLLPIDRMKEEDVLIENTGLDRWFVQYQQESAADLKADAFYTLLPAALNRCLSVDPAKRDLTEAIAALQNGLGKDPETEQNVEPEILHLSYENHTLSWQQTRQLEPGVQAFIFNAFYHKVEEMLSSKVINCPDCFVLASYYINGYGTAVDHQAARRLLERCSRPEYNHPSSRAYSYRIVKALDPEYTMTPADYDNLSVMALRGSRPALCDLKDVAPAQYAWSQPILRDVLAGVGASFFHDTNMLGFAHRQWVYTFDRPEMLVTNLRPLQKIAEHKVNRRGDGILHLAASTGRIQAVESLLGAFPLDINQRNEAGETPLLCACRAGQLATVLRLVQLNADASIAAANGESCLHWLVSFQDIEAVGEALLQTGAPLRGYTRERVAYSDFPAGIDVDFQIAGTPLTWAIHHDRPDIVRFLVSKNIWVALDETRDSQWAVSPLEYAAFFHHVECLQVLMDALDQAGARYSMAPILTAAVHAADTFSMILRNGARYRQRLHATLDVCLARSRPIVFGSGIGGFDTSLLFFAVSEAHDEVVEYLLSQPGDDDQDALSGAYTRRDINRPAADHRRTPVLEAIRWNRKHIVELLLSHGADITASARNPFTNELTWTGFHILATAGHDLGDISYLLKAGLSLQELPSTESPFLVALQHNVFDLASSLLTAGAQVSALCCDAGFLSLEYPTSVLGHLIAASAQHTIPRLRYLLRCSVDFIVEPTRQLSALHRAAWAYKGIMHRGEKKDPVTRHGYDMMVNRDIMAELLEKWGTAEHVNLPCGIHGRTALHLAVAAGNIHAVELLRGKADASLRDDLGMNALELAKSSLEKGSAIVDLLS
ncbi:hypothetical protein ASPZODRAFT_143828 [Penicilliopsis zonata CBS 506.65]|uniref:Protein kinase domain-containing protein n=1 Tax=Penicilliopsis zonata CBS 506.65 TaxID=1073090 RepID=A0A1L9SFB4_9EURO|nr:hypothetical protein ASPZODRAFT_143828 [Penicilliopsis zonata CBS 506.65]OJJ45965.1 hypothetical protein ASPZODRAFT_143828 [Penicilliopsis zonata CBS 506.65]